MSDLRHKSVNELRRLKTETEKKIATLKSQVSGQQERLKWINSYITEKTPREMTFEEIERALGHKVIIK
jgi:chaperonin cofactor prefoldin